MQQPPPYPSNYAPPAGGPGYTPYPQSYTNDQFNPHSSPYQPASDPFLDSNPATFSDISIRHGFIRKVYSIISLQMIVTAIIVACVCLIDSVKGFFLTNTWLLYLFMIGTIVIMIILACCESVARKHPHNLILLGIFTIFESFLIGTISSTYKTDTLLIAVGITCVVVIAITIFAFQTKIDFTGCGIYLFVMVLLLLIFGIISMIIRTKIVHMIYAALGAGIFSMYLIFDTQLMLGGKHKYSISPEDYIMAALNLYVDIINLFLMILRLVGMSKD